MFFMFLLMNHGRVSAKSARSGPVKPRPLPNEIPQVIPQDLSAEMLSAEMLPPWENIPQGWSQGLLGNELKQFDPDNVIPVPETINPNTGTTNPANWLIQGAPRLPEFQVPKLFILDQCTGTTIMCLAGVVGKEAGSSIATFDTDSELVGIDNRSSVCMSPHRSDFIGKLIKSKRFIKAFGGTKSFDIYIGTLKWVFDDDEGVERTVYVPESFYIPEAPARLLSPQHWAQEAYAMSDTGDPDATYCETFHNRAMLYWGEKPYVKTVSIDSQNVFTFGLKSGFDKFSAFCTEVAYDAEKDEYAPDCTDEFLDDESVTSTVMDIETLDDFDLDDSSEVPEGVLTDSEGENSDSEGEEVDLDGEKAVEQTEWILDTQREDPSAELLRYHYKFGHPGFRRLKAMARKGTIPKRLADCPNPVCAACLYGKAHKRPKRTKAKAKHVPRPVSKPGDCVSVDVLVSATPGLIAQMRGFLTRQRYKYAAVFIDHYSDFSYVHLMTNQDGDNICAAKAAFEKYCLANGVNVQHYHTDNGIFACRQWQDDCTAKRQGFTYSGVNAHHQSGRVERRIRSLQDQGRSMLIHANHRWSTAITAHLWPYAIRAANDSLNATPAARFKHDLSPLQVFSGTAVDVNHRHWNPIFCPAYVLTGPLQTTGIQDKWRERSTPGIYLGRSPLHARSVALVLNLKTGRVSPQFHVALDPTFSTVSGRDGTQPPVSLWQMQCGFRKGNKHLASEETHSVEPEFISPSDVQEASDVPETVSDPDDRGNPEQDSPVNPVTTDEGMTSPTESEPPGLVARSTTQSQSRDARARRSQDAPAPRRSTRSGRGQSAPTFAEQHGQYYGGRSTSAQAIAGEIFAFQALFAKDEDTATCMAASSDPDTMYFHQAMREPDAPEFLEAAQEEFGKHLKDGTFEIIPLSEVPEGFKLFPAVWAMKRKRKVRTREIYKRKARLNFDGSKQKKGDYDQTFAPVASWESVRILLALVLRNSWHTIQLDYVLAFPQAPVDRECYMQIPKGIKIDAPGKWALRVHKNIYGQKQAGRVWNQYLVDKLVNQVGFKQSKHDECVFYRGNVMYVLYTDDSILAGPDKDELKQVIADIKSAGLDVTEEGDIEDFLGVNIDRVDDDTYHLSQPHLIEQILRDLNLDGENVQTKETPSPLSRVLGAHKSSAEFDGHFHYRSVIGKLNYLEKCSRPDIAYATHQCARFSSDPRKEHGEAVKWLGRYLRATRDKGIYIRPTDDTFKVWADADFSGNWIPEEAEGEPDTARSRSGYIMSYLGCPILWKSQLQTEIALSSTESEYIALSQAARKVKPLMLLIQEMKKEGFNVGCSTPTVKCTLFEDNSGTVYLANAPSMRPCTKHINVKYHHFRSMVASRALRIEKTSSEEQLADFLTKQSSIELYLAHRMAIMGW